MFLYVFSSLLKFHKSCETTLFATKSQKNCDKIIWNSWSVKSKVAQRCTRWGPKNVTVGVPRASRAGVPRVSRAGVPSIWWLGCPDLWKQQLLFLCLTMFLEGAQRSFRKILITTFLELTFPNSGCSSAATSVLFRSEIRVNFAFWLLGNLHFLLFWLPYKNSGKIYPKSSEMLTNLAKLIKNLVNKNWQQNCKIFSDFWTRIWA